MSEPELVKMADIVPLMPEASADMAVLALAVLALVGLLLVELWWLLRRYRAPLARLERALLAGKISPREAAHRLVQLAPMVDEQRRWVDRLRFASEAPERFSVLQAIRDVRHGH